MSGRIGWGLWDAPQPGGGPVGHIAGVLRAAYVPNASSSQVRSPWTEQACKFACLISLI